MSEQYVAAIDQGTTSTRCMIFNHDGRVVSVDQKEHEQIFPQAGWVEHNADRDLGQHPRGDRGRAGQGRPDRQGHRRRRHHQPAGDRAGLGPHHRRAGLQRDRLAGHPHRRDLPASWARSAAAPTGTRPRSGLPLATYFSGPKVRWILDNVDGARDKAEAGDLVFGNMDTWVIWNMTGGVDGGLHITDPTNASRTMLMDLDTLSWDADIAERHGHPAVHAAGDPLAAPRCTARSASAACCAGRADRRRSSATSRRPPSARPACRSARPRTPTAPATSC